MNEHRSGNGGSRAVGAGLLSLLLASTATAKSEDAAAAADAPAAKPNILVIWGDDVGVHNISAYNHGIMGYRTPNIDRIAKEGALFTDSYAQQSCTAGRSARSSSGSIPFRTGLLDHRHAGLRARHPRLDADASRDLLEGARATPPVSSARITSAIGTSTCRRTTASTSSSGTSTT